ncbi:hypothetical protein JTB14_005936 [Gonioctena quinquepunctata]|nr:hypothetical protein JTB14_005936 [Gonioctena quinquepunctata]
MADDSQKIPDYLNFHPCNTPRGMSYYKLDILTKEQKKELFDQKLELVRDNQRYLKRHPEIRAVVSLVLKTVLKARPKVKVRHFLANYFAEHSDVIKKTIEECSIVKSLSLASEELGSELAEESSSSSSESLEFEGSSLLYLMKDISDYSFHAVKPVTDPEILTICGKMLDEILDIVCREDVVTQMKHFFGRRPESDFQLELPSFDNKTSASLLSRDYQMPSNIDVDSNRIDDRSRIRYDI